MVRPILRLMNRLFTIKATKCTVIGEWDELTMSFQIAASSSVVKDAHLERQ